MTEDQRELLEMARESLAATQALRRPARTTRCSTWLKRSSRGEGLAYSKHSAVIAAFGQHFARTGRVPVEFHRFLRESQDVRHSGDYGAPHSVPADKAEAVIAQAQDFLELAERCIGPLPEPRGKSG